MKDICGVADTVSRRHFSSSIANRILSIYGEEEDHSAGDGRHSDQKRITWPRLLSYRDGLAGFEPHQDLWRLCLSGNRRYITPASCG